MELPAEWFEEVTGLRELLPAGRVMKTTERWLGDLLQHAYEVVIRVESAGAFSALAAAATSRIGRRPQRMKEQRKLMFAVGDWSYMAFGADGEEYLQLIVSRPCDADSALRGGQRLVRELGWLKPFSDWPVKNAVHWRAEGGANDGGWAEFDVDDVEAVVGRLQADYPDLSVTTRMDRLRIQRGLP